MSEEEKKAIENVKRMFEDITIEELLKDKNFNTTIYSLGILDILRVIAIVEKQQKEIEELKSQLDFIDEQNRFIDKLEKVIEKLKDKQEYARLEKEQLLEDSINKDKIREKIKELEELPQNQYIHISGVIDEFKELLGE